MDRRKRSVRAFVAEELEILPMMNLFVVLIPMLLLSAVFLEMSVIRMGLPSDEADESPAREGLGLAIAIRDDVWVVQGQGLATVSIDRSAPEAAAVLRATLSDVSARFPDDHDVVVRSSSHTRYEDIVAVMDASRESGFPGVALAGGGA